MNTRIKSYLSFAGLALVSGVAKGQMIYTDIIPDAMITPPLSGGIQNFLIDLDQDGVNDFSVVADSISYACTFSSTSSYSIYYIPVRSIRFLAIAPLTEIGTSVNTNCSNYQKLTRFNLNQPISFNNPAPVAFAYFSGTCNCNSVSSSSYNDFYVGLKFFKGGQPRIGWLRFTQIDEILILKDFAYCDGNTATLPAGTMNYNVGLAEPESAFTMEVSGRQLTLNMADGERYSVEVFSLLGQEIVSLENQQGSTGYLFNGAGIYLVKVQTAQGVFTRKIYVTE